MFSALHGGRGCFAALLAGRGCFTALHAGRGCFTVLHAGRGWVERYLLVVAVFSATCLSRLFTILLLWFYVFIMFLFFSHAQKSLLIPCA